VTIPDENFGVVRRFLKVAMWFRSKQE